MALRGYVEAVSRQEVVGWAWDPDLPDTPVSLVVSANGQVLGRVLANVHRKDLEEAAIGGGRHGFAFRPAQPLSPLAPATIAVRREVDGAHLTGSPWALETAAAFDGAMREAITRVLSAVGEDDADLERRLAFLAAQADALKRIHAERRSGAHERVHRRRLGLRDPAATAEAGAAPARPRALVIDDCLPQADRDAGSNAVLSHLRALQRIGFAVSFAPATLRGDPAALEAEGVGCCLHPWYASIEEVLMRQREAFALVYLHRVTNAGRYVALARDHQPKARLVYSVADLHHLRLARQAELEERPELRAFSERMRLMELSAAWQSDAVITHSSFEADLLRKAMPPAKVHLVPWAVPLRPTAVPFVERRGLAFVGNFGHRPNVDAAQWLVDAVMPELDRLDGEIACLIVGSAMPEGLRRLRRHNVEPVGHVPDLSRIFDRVRLSVAPLAYGAGIKGKVLDSLAAGVPCVCTPAAAEGLDLPEPLKGQIAATPADLARRIAALHDDAALNAACAEAGLAFIAETANEARVDALMRQVAGPAAPPRAGA